MASLKVADLEIDALHQRIQQGAREIRLTPVEHVLLYTLAANAGVVVTYRRLADALGKPKPLVSNNTLARHMSGVRRKLKDDAVRPRYVETVFGVGYRLRVRPSPTDPLAADAPTTASRILIVEDDREVSRLVQVALDDDGYRVAAADDGEHALGECAIEDPALILLDLHLPGMDGAEFLQAYRARPQAQAKVVVISGATNAAEFARQVVADAFMGKPFDVEILLRTVRRLLPRFPALDAS